jgi:ferredoxin
MIIGQQKPLKVILEMLDPYEKVIVAGCHGCVTVCRSGGEKEVEILASAIRLARESTERPIEIREVTLERQCDPEYVETMRPYIQDYQAVLSIACGAAVQFVAEKYPFEPCLPGLDTTFIGVTEKQGVWAERCQACGECVLHLTGGICPVSRCSKSLFNGPCGGTTPDGHCEVSKDIPCGWMMIIDRLRALNMLDSYRKILPMKRWKASRDGGPRRIEREDLKE